MVTLGFALSNPRVAIFKFYIENLRITLGFALSDFILSPPALFLRSVS